LRKHSKRDWTQAALCTTEKVAGNNLPKQLGDAEDCAKSSIKSSDSYAVFGLCMVAHEGSGDAQKIAECYAEGQGIPAAVAVSLAADHLTKDQRIVLECAAETNGAVPATAGDIGCATAIRSKVS
jgi:hypothetical protein